MLGRTTDCSVCDKCSVLRAPAGQKTRERAGLEEDDAGPTPCARGGDPSTPSEAHPQAEVRASSAASCAGRCHSGLGLRTGDWGRAECSTPGLAFPGPEPEQTPPHGAIQSRSPGYLDTPLQFSSQPTLLHSLRLVIYPNAKIQENPEPLKISRPPPPRRAPGTSETPLATSPPQMYLLSLEQQGYLTHSPKKNTGQNQRTHFDSVF